MILQGPSSTWPPPVNSHTANLLRSGRGGQQWGGRKGEKAGSEGLFLLKFLFLFLLFFFSTIVTIFSIGCLHFMCPGIVLGACSVDLMQDRHPDPLCLPKVLLQGWLRFPRAWMLCQE